jgi:transcriptional regulator with XRE-family HTH domain
MGLRVEPAAESIGERLRRLRRERGLSQRDLSEPGISYAYISRIEAGARQPSVKALRLLARKLGVSPDYLETGIELGAAQRRDLELADAELRLRLENDPAGTREQLQRLLGDAQAAGDLPAQTRARISLGLLAAEQGEHGEAIEQFELVLGSGTVTPLTRPDVYAALGRAYAAHGEQLKAAELWEECVRRVGDEEPDDSAARTRFATYLSYALGDLGQFDRAQEVLQDALGAGADLTDPYTQIRLYWALARVLALQGRAREALAYAQRATALLEASEDRLQVGRAHLLCAGILNLEERAQEALPHLEVAERAFEPGAAAVDLASLRCEQAKAAAQLGGGDEAVLRAREALALLDDGDPAEQGAAFAALAGGLALQGEESEADDAYSRALTLLKRQQRWREAAQAARSWGRFLRAAGREHEALEALEQAADLAAR